MSAESSNRRIARNALMLYIRMFLTMIVGLYTSRVVLATLGVEDYGIYGVVGGVVAMMGFLNASMSGATSRFLTFELGRRDKAQSTKQNAQSADVVDVEKGEQPPLLQEGDGGRPVRSPSDRLAATFSSALIVHIGIALVVLVLAETVGLWFLCNKLVIPAGRMAAAHWVYQCSILSAMLSITQAPYNASIIAHEKMDVYAYVEILNVSLKLLIVYLLVIGDFDKLILYAILMLAVSVLVMLVYRIYCIRRFAETRFYWVWDKTILKPLLSFSGWNIYGNLGGIAYQQGTNFVINIFFGVAMNAAASVGLTIANTVNHFAANVMTAFRPQITKSYARQDYQDMQKTTALALKVILLIYSLVAIPVFVEADNLLRLWLVEVPQYSGLFCRILIISIFFQCARYILIIDIHATGNVKWVSAATGTMFIIVPFVVWLLYRLGFASEYAFYCFAVANLLLGIINLRLIKHYVPQVAVRVYAVAILQVIFVSVLTLIATHAACNQFTEHFLRLFFTAAVSTVLLGVLAYALCLNRWQRDYVIHFVKSKLHLS